MRRLFASLLLTLAIVLAGCDVLTGPDEHVERMFVASYTRECMGMVVQQCMLVKERPEDDWQNFYGGINGFTYEPGYEYELIIGWREIKNPPADGSSRDYRLIRLVSKTPAA